MYYDADYIGRRVNWLSYFDCVSNARNSNFIGFDVDWTWTPKPQERFPNKKKGK